MQQRLPPPYHRDEIYSTTSLKPLEDVHRAHRGAEKRVGPSQFFIEITKLSFPYNCVGGLHTFFN